MNNNLVVKNLTKLYKSGKGIHEINFELGKGMIMGIIGLNGAGKTTLLNALTGQLKYDSGTIHYNINGEHFKKPNQKLMDYLGIVSEDYGFPDHFSAKTVSKIMNSNYRNWDQKRFMEILDQLELDFNLKTSKYSSGMKTKLALAIALSHNAKILILDEATKGLDIRACSRVRDLLHSFVSSGENSVLLTSHVLGEIERVADTIMLIEFGKVQFINNKDDLLYQHKIFQITSEQLEEMNKQDIYRIRRLDYAIYIIAKDSKEFSTKYKIEAVSSSLDRVIEIILEGDAV